MKVQNISKSLILLCLSVFILSVSGCKDPESPSPSVHVVGYAESKTYDSNSGTYISSYEARYWKNGEVVDLDINTSYNSGAYDVTVSDRDVYIAGYDSGHAVYWKNGEKHILPSGTFAISIFVDGDDVYNAGFVSNSGTLAPVYWKNDTIYNLINSGTGEPSSIYIYNSQVYIAGTDDSKAVYWEGNTIKHELSINNGEALSIFVTSDGIYIAGYESVNGKNAAKYWHIDSNGTKSEIVLYQNNSYDAEARSIYVYNGDVYVSGYYVYSDKSIARYWKNNSSTAVNLLSFPDEGIADSICVYDGDVYTAGWKNTDKVDAYFWKNSDGSKLPSDTLYVTRATGIFFEQ